MAFEREVTVAVGRSDGRTVLIVPEVKGQPVHGHHPAARPLPRPPGRAHACAACSQGYRHRYAALRDAITETEPAFRDDLLGTLPVVDLLTAPVLVMAAAWKPTD